MKNRGGGAWQSRPNGPATAKSWVRPEGATKKVFTNSGHAAKSNVNRVVAETVESSTVSPPLATAHATAMRVEGVIDVDHTEDIFNHIGKINSRIFVYVNGEKLSAIIDSGTDLTILRTDALKCKPIQSEGSVELKPAFGQKY